MQLTFRGSVNRWECDENDHLNVRFYLEKHWQTLCGWLGGLIHKPVTTAAASGCLQTQHIRFLQESRLAAPLSGYTGVVAADDGVLMVLTELRHSFSEEVLSTCVHTLCGLAAPVTDSLPEHAAPRGVPDQELEYAHLPTTELARYGFAPIGLGVAQAGECQPNGDFMVHNYMARISDGMPHLWGELDENQGGAVLEYRLRYHQPLCRDQAFAVWSGIAEVGTKVQRFAHLIFEVGSGALCVSAQAAGVRMDLQARRAMTLSEAWQTRLRERMLQPLVE